VWLAMGPLFLRCRAEMRGMEKIYGECENARRNSWCESVRYGNALVAACLFFMSRYAQERTCGRQDVVCVSIYLPLPTNNIRQEAKEEQPRNRAFRARCAIDSATRACGMAATVRIQHLL
jgi:hypothetical protein